MVGPPAPIVKVYPERNGMQQHRLDRAVTFICSRCSVEKTAKLVAIGKEGWQKLLCNGCYGKLLSEG